MSELIDRSIDWIDSRLNSVETPLFKHLETAGEATDRVID
jgi:hypothetical protein